MKKLGVVALLALALVLVPAVLTAQIPPAKGQASDKLPIGDLKTMPMEGFNLDAVTGIGKSINLAPYAFVADPYQYPIYYSYNGGYLQGGTGGYAECFASVPFTKGAKKIVAVYFLMYTNNVSDAYIAIYRNPWGSALPTRLVGGWNGLTGWQIVYWVPPTASQPVINPADNFYLEFYANNGAFLKGAAVLYK